MTTSLDCRRRSLSEGCHLNRLTSQQTKAASGLLAFAPEQPVDDLHPLLLAGGESLALAQRSKSESFICTAQGIVIQDTQCQKYQARLNRLVALAADATSSQSNVLLAKKALRYRKVLERRRVAE